MLITPVREYRPLARCPNQRKRSFCTVLIGA
jgi:hypothetical protein